VRAASFFYLVQPQSIATVKCRSDRTTGNDKSLIAPLYGAGDSAPLFMLIGKRKRIRRDNAVAAGVLGLVHSHVGATQNAVYGIAAFPLGNAKAAGDAERFRLCEAQDFN
jgi:hypothetical protein